MNKSQDPSATPVGARRGRRPGRSRTRGEILEVARHRFLAEGYRDVTLRSVAAEAGVDVALLSYYFGSKKGLFGASLELLANPPEILAAALPGDAAGRPERILRALVTTWDDPEHGAQLRLLVGAATQEPDLARLLAEVLQHEIFDRITETLRGPNREQRAAAMGTQLAGVVLARYVLRLEPVASMPADEFILHLRPGIHAVLNPPSPRAAPSADPSRSRSPVDR